MVAWARCRSLPKIKAPFALRVMMLAASSSGLSFSYMGELCCVGMSRVKMTSFTAIGTP
jgi:hypothetical protein